MLGAIYLPFKNPEFSDAKNKKAVVTMVRYIPAHDVYTETHYIRAFRSIPTTDVTRVPERFEVVFGFRHVPITSLPS